MVLCECINSTENMALYLHLAWPNYGLDVLNITIHTEINGNTFNEYLCVVLEQNLWLT